jgi:hypothetical protein
MSVTDVSPRSHTDTPAWQSFEQRMRVRAAERRAAKRRRRQQYAALAFVALCGVAMGWFVVSSLPLLARMMEVHAPAAPAPPRAAATLSAEPLPVPTPVAMLDNPMGDATLSAEPAPESTPAQASVETPAERLSRPASNPARQPVVTSARRVEPTDRPVGTSLREPDRVRATDVALAEAERTPAPAERTPAPPRPPAERVETSPGNTATNGGGSVNASPIAPASQPPASIPAPEAKTADAPNPIPPNVGSASPSIDSSRAREAVRGTIEQYRSAYERLDAAAARAVWPGVDADALSRAFGSLESQRLSFEGCTIDVAGAVADATCTGRASVVPKIGGGSQTVRRTWRFKLAQAGESWRIASATVR